MNCNKCQYENVCKRKCANCVGKIDENSCDCLCQKTKAQEFARSVLSVGCGMIGVSGIVLHLLLLF